MISLYSKLQYSYAYLIYFCVLFFLSLLEMEDELLKKKYQINTVLVMLLVAIYVLFWGLRGFIYTDCFFYYNFYQTLPKLRINGFFSEMKNYVPALQESSGGFEKGFIIYSVFLRMFCNDYYYWQLVNTIIDFILLYTGLKYFCQDRIIFAFVIVFLFNGMVMEVNLLRNSKSIFLFLISLRYIDQRNIIKYFIIITIGYFFHTTSLLFYPFYFILNKKYNKRFILIVFFIGLFFYVFRIKWVYGLLTLMFDIIHQKRLLDLLYYYLNSKTHSAAYGFGLGFIERLVSFFIVYKISDRIDIEKKFRLIVNLMYIYIFITLYFSEMEIIITRVAILFSIGYWCYYPWLICNLKTKNKLIGISIVFFYGLIKINQLTNILCFDYTNLIFTRDFIQDRYFNLKQFLQNRRY